MASRFETFSENEICAINDEAVVQKKITRKRRTLACWCSLKVENFFHAEFATKS